MTLAATAVICVALYVLSRLFPTGTGDIISRPMLRAVRLFILIILHLLGISLYAVAVSMGLLGASLRVVVYSFVPILGQVFWIQSSWWNGPFLTDYAIAFAAWLVLVVLAFVTGAFKERLAPPATTPGVSAPAAAESSAPVQN